MAHAEAALHAEPEGLQFIGSVSRIDRPFRADQAIATVKHQEPETSTSGGQAKDRSALAGAEREDLMMARSNLAEAWSRDEVTVQIAPFEPRARAAGAGGRRDGDGLQFWELRQ